MRTYFTFFILIFCPLIFADDSLPTTPKIKTLFSALNPTSLSQNFAFYELYPETREGRLALKRAWRLLKKEENASDIALPKVDIQPLIEMINREDSSSTELKEEELSFIESLGKNLQNRKLKGFNTWDKNFALEMNIDEIDLCRSLFLAQYEDDPQLKTKVRTYEASIDLMALQILAELSDTASNLDKIHAINQFIFHEMGFRFPPQSLWAKDIDVYTFLPSVIDSRKGVCLGVSILYLCLAQRLNLPLEAITPPGHIYVRYVLENEEHLNIETTARGIHVPSEMYMGLETKKLQTRNIKEVIGLAFMNQASVSWAKNNHPQAIELYEKALLYLPDDDLVQTFLAYNYLFENKNEKGIALLKEKNKKTAKYSITADTITEDFLQGKTDAEGIKAIFMQVDETRDSILEKQQTLQKVTQKHPHFRAALLQLAGTYLQLGREKEALPILEKYHKLDAQDPIVNYYLAVICYGRYDYKRAWHFFKIAQDEVHKKDHDPRTLKELHKALMRTCPDPLSSS